MNLPKGTQLVDGKTMIQTLAYLSPKVVHNLFNNVTFAAEVC